MKSADRLTWEQAVERLRQQPGKQELVKACYYDDPLAEAAERYFRSEEWQEVSRLLHDRIPSRVLDIGAGRGISSYAFARQGCAVVSVEPDPSPLVGVTAIRGLAVKSGLPITAVQACGESLPFRQSSFDIVYGRAVLHHAQDLGKLLRDAARVLKPGGVFMATREHVISRPQDLDAFLASHPLHALYGGENAYLLEQYKAALQASGLKLLQAIGPHKSVINYAPQSRRQYTDHIAVVLQRYTGKHVSRFLVAFPWAVKLLCSYFSWRSTVPGRLYSFIAEKP